MEWRKAKSDEQASVAEINSRETYSDDSERAKQVRYQISLPPEMKSVLCKYKRTITSHIAFSLLGMFLALKFQNTKNSKSLENLGTEEWSAKHSQASFEV